jgi:hypothetical protein
MEQIIKISEFILRSFLHIWPYLLITIPLAVVVTLSGASKYIKKAFGKNPLISVLLATIVGAFSPFCSCGVIPIISSLLIGGVPLAPVMSFWIASPSIDPEIFFLSSSMIGWKLAIWRLFSTIIISLLAGYITHFATIRGYIGNNNLRTQTPGEGQNKIRSLIDPIRYVLRRKPAGMELVSEKGICLCQPDFDECNCADSDKKESLTQLKRVASEIVKATVLVTKFMGIAFLITAIMNFYVPQDLINRIVTLKPATQVVLATFIGIPMYTSNITALPLVGGLVDLGLNQGAALSFLIAGATTTLPAMAAVWGITRKKVFLLYISFALFGSLLAGLCYSLLN